VDLEEGGSSDGRREEDFLDAVGGTGGPRLDSPVEIRTMAQTMRVWGTALDRSMGKLVRAVAAVR